MSGCSTNNTNSTKELKINTNTEIKENPNSEQQKEEEKNQIETEELSNEKEKVDPTEFLVRQQYFEESFKPKREEYKIFEKAAAYLNKPVSEMPKLFTLKSEAEIFEELPKIPKDFSELAFALASGKTYDIGNIGEEYYKQPEFYPNFKTNGLKYWTNPEPKYWATGGYGTYPAEQFDTLSLSGRKEFNAAVFVYSGYGVQTYQGLTLVPTAETLKNFEIEITPNTILLEPNFPKFKNGWAHKIFISGKLKEGAKPGKYDLAFVIAAPPKEKKDEWGFKYRNLYYDAVSGIAPSGYPVKFTINVIE
ncbi:MAG: hypothetical protein QXZ13_03485 [Candidatus Diapherotrites archaeon]